MDADADPGRRRDGRDDLIYPSGTVRSYLLIVPLLGLTWAAGCAQGVSATGDDDDDTTTSTGSGGTGGVISAGGAGAGPPTGGSAPGGMGTGGMGTGGMAVARHLAPRLPTDLPNRPFESAILPGLSSTNNR